MKRTKIRNILLSALLALTVGMPTLSFADEGASAELGAAGGDSTPYTAGDKGTVADPNTASTWRDWGLDYSTQSVGRIWTDKTVSTEGIALTGADGTITIEKSPEADFLTAFSALSSTSNLKSTVAQPLDIVLVLDASGSMSDPMGKDDNTKRIDALKAAANSFIDEIAKQNASISDPAQQHQVSLVKFSGNKSNQVGNDTYRKEGYTYNYSQVMKNLTSCVGSSVDDLKSTVNAISPAGSTRADYGLELAADQASGRENAKKIVVFFTDGSPTSSSGFESGVAGDAVSAAKSMKDAGATIYSVGIFSGANPSADPTASGTSRENKFMHAVSSNYPTASYAWQDGQRPWQSGEWVWSFGARAANSDFYKAASNAADLKTLFDEISREITSSTGLPTEVQQGYDPSTSGYITFTDQLGDYMKVDSFTTIVFAKQLFKNPVKLTSGNVDTYTFSGEAGNVLYPSGNLSSIVITVTRSDNLATGDLVEVKIPASLIPLRHFQIDESAGTGSVDLTFPIRVFFESSVKEGMESALANPDATLAAYIEANTTDNGVAFYANKWSGGADGDVAATFTPAKSNSYYYMTEETPIYTDKECTVPAKGALSADGTYYYKRSWYKIDNGNATLQSDAIQFSGNVPESWLGYIGTDASGNAVFKAGTPRFTYINELRTPKGANPTATAKTVLNPLWSGSSIACHLGNNGKLVIEKPGTLAISKSLVVPEGYNRADFVNDTFTFDIQIDKAKGQEFPAEVRDAKGELAGTAFKITFDGSGKATHSIKDGETLYIFGLDGGWDYSVSEQSKAGFTQVAPVDNGGAPVTAKGAIPAGSQAKAEFTNGYHPTGTLVGRNSLVIHKVLKGRIWSESDNFRFVLRAVTSDAPMPLDDEGKPVSAITLTKNNSTGAGYAMGTFGNITYTKPGTYVYEISEDQTLGAGAGMSLSQARYQVTVTVTEELAEQGDNAIHQGILNVSSVMVQIYDDGGAIVQPDNGVDAATFTNEFAAQEAKWEPQVKKEYTDNSGANPLERGMFNFLIERVSDGAPMPKNTIGAVNADGSVEFEDIVFTGDMVGKSFEYRITEVVRGANGEWINVADSAAKPYLQPGMTYDESTWNVTVKVTGQEIDDELVVVCEASYAKPVGGGEVESLDQAKFVNSYTPESVSVPAEGFAAGTKILTGRDMRASETFGFALKPADDATKAAIDARTVTLGKMTATVSNEAMSFDFGGATFAKPGTYTFTVRENAWNGNDLPKDGTGGMTFDRHEAVVKITVTDNNGKLSATRAVENSLNFTNRYTAEGDYTGLVLSKTLNGRNMAAEEFSFTIAGADDASKKLLGGDGTRTFVNSEPRAAGVAYEATLLTDLHFTQDDVGKTFTFDVHENVPSVGAPGMTYDKTVYSVAISVASDDAGKLVVTTTVDGAVGNKVSFTNVYAAGPVTFDTQAGFGLYKVLEGRHDWTDGDRFVFILDALTPNAPRPESTRATVDASQVNRETGRAPISFGDITFDKAGTYKYRVTEENAGRIIDGVKYTNNVAEFAVTVTDVDAQGIHTGQLVATAQLTTTPNTREFTNVAGFKYDDNQIPVNAFKRFVNNSTVEMPDMTGLFTFTLTAAEENAPMPVRTAHNDADGSVDFGVITFGTSLFDNGLTVVNSAPAAKSAASESSAADKAIASDVPAADAAAAPEAGALAPDEGDAAKGEGSAPADAGAVPAADATAAPAAKPASDGPTTDNPPAPINQRVFHYTITEQAGGHADVTNDPNPVFSFEVTVTRDDAGNVTASVTSISNYVKGEPLHVFTNTYAYAPPPPTPVDPDPDPIVAAPVAKKILEGRALVAGEFTFELVENGKVVSTGTNDANGNVTFSGITYAAAGTHVYTMREVGAGTTAAGVTYDTTTYQVTAKVVESGGKLRATFAIDGADAAVFKNAYAPMGTTVILGATKTLAGRDLAAGEFTFKLTGADGRTYEAKNAADGRIEFPAIAFDKPGTYEFTLTEVNDGQTGITYDEHVHKAIVTVSDDGKGNLVAKATWPNGTPPTFANTFAQSDPGETPTPGAKTTPGPKGWAGTPYGRLAKTGDAAMPIVCAAALAILAAGAACSVAYGLFRKNEKEDAEK